MDADQEGLPTRSGGRACEAEVVLHLDAPPRIDGVVIGILSGFGAADAASGGAGAPLVDFPGNPHDDPIPARSMVDLRHEAVGREVALLFEAADPGRPVLMGLIRVPGRDDRPPLSARFDGERIELSAEREIVLRCGSASITLTRAGKVLIRGAYVSSQSSGVNTIKGGAVHIN